MNCKFYSEEIGKCLFDGPPDDCPFENNEDNCTCFEPIKENKKESKNMKMCKFYAETARRGWCSNVDCLLEKCYFDDNFNGCELFEPAKCEKESYKVMKKRIEDKEGSEVVKRFKENLDQMMCIKISKFIGDVKAYKFVDHARVIDNCLGNFIVIDCTNDKVYTYSYAEYSWEKWPKESGEVTLQSDKAETVKPILDSSRSIDKRTLTIQNCDKIIIKPKSLEVEVKIEKDNFEDFDFIEINGHKFKKV